MQPAVSVGSSGLMQMDSELSLIETTRTAELLESKV